jgi:hypothetical protein
MRQGEGVAGSQHAGPYVPAAKPTGGPFPLTDAIAHVSAAVQLAGDVLGTLPPPPTGIRMVDARLELEHARRELQGATVRISRADHLIRLGRAS